MIFKNISGCCSLLCSDDSGYQWHHQFKCQFQCLAPDKWTTRTFPGAFKWVFLNHNIFFYEALSPIPLAIFGFPDKLFCAALLTSLGQNQDPRPLLSPLHRHQHLHHLQQHLLMDSQVVRVLGRLQLRPHISSSKHLLKWSVHREKVWCCSCNCLKRIHILLHNRRSKFTAVISLLELFGECLATIIVYSVSSEVKYFLMEPEQQSRVISLYLVSTWFRERLEVISSWHLTLLTPGLLLARCCSQCPVSGVGALLRTWDSALLVAEQW